MWTASDSSALRSVFDTVWEFFNTEFQVLNFTTSWWQIALSCFAILLVFRIVKGLIDL